MSGSLAQTTNRLPCAFRWGHEMGRKRAGLELNQDPVDFFEDLQTPTKKPLRFYARSAQTGEVIRDGHLFHVRTDKPTARPLPSIRIMQVYYRMALMMRLAGAAEDDSSSAAYIRQGLPGYGRGAWISLESQS
ncbi:hypothetical protein LY76DRAFT_599163 [Colletotrichum caudatum]|nr:hypothetical protein LY76DRAFT_599163 [Colletotrichum caudatum]